MHTGLREFSQLTDSREILESEPNRILPFFLVLLTVLFAFAGVWSVFGRIDTVSIAYGLIRSETQTGTASSLVSGVVEYARYEEGDKVQKGEILLKFDPRENAAALKNGESEIDRIENEIAYHEKLKESICQKENFFTTGVKQESLYDNRVRQYLLSYENKKQEFEASLLQADQQYHAIEQEEETNQLNIRQEEEDTKRQQQEKNKRREALQEQKDRISTERRQAVFLQRAVSNGGSLPQEADDKSRRQLSQYQDDLEPWKKSLTGVENSDLPILQQIKTYRHQASNQIQSQIEDADARLQAINDDLKALPELSDESANSEQLNLRSRQLEDQKDSLNRQIKVLKQSRDDALARLEAEAQLQIDIDIDDLEKQLREFEYTVQALELEQATLVIKAPLSGTVHVLKEVGVGDRIETGETLFTIIPEDEYAYRISLLVPNAEIGKIKTGNNVDLSIDAFPKQRYGTVKGIVLSIGSDSVVQKDGASGYLVEASIQRNSMSLYKDMKDEIRVGMTVKASIITGSQSILDYILGKIDFKNT